MNDFIFVVIELQNYIEIFANKTSTIKGPCDIWTKHEIANFSGNNFSLWQLLIEDLLIQ